MSLNRMPLIALVLVWCAILIVPVLLLFPWSFMRMQNYAFVYDFGLDSFNAILGSGRDAVIWQTLRIAALVTVIDLVLALPFAVWLAKGVKSPTVKALALAALTIPFFISLSSRTMILRPLLGTNGAVNLFLMHFGIIDQPLDWLLFSEFSVHLGLIGPSFPSMALPIYLAVSLIDDELIAAARDIGAPPISVATDVILPLSLPGILAGITFTFVPLMGDTVVPHLLGGGQVNMLGGSVSSLVQVLNYTVAAAMSVSVLIILALFLLLLGVIIGRFASFSAALSRMS